MKLGYELPNYPLRAPACAGDLYDIIECDGTRNQERLPYTSSYQGATSYRWHDQALEFRWAKVPWRWSWGKPEDRYWNYVDEGEFQRKGPNASWGIVHRYSSNPVWPECLALCREVIDSRIVTGYFDFLAMRWVICEPDVEPLSTNSYNIFRARGGRLGTEP